MDWFKEEYWHPEIKESTNKKYWDSQKQYSDKNKQEYKGSTKNDAGRGYGFFLIVSALTKISILCVFTSIPMYSLHFIM